MKAVGFDQKIQLAHLDITANLLRIHSNKNEMYPVLDEHLLTSIKGDKSRKNAITMLMKTWSLVDESIQDLQQRLINEYPYFTREEKLVVHYCLTCIAYPFFRTQMSYVGKQLKMADVIYSKTVVAEMKNLYGDRRRVEVATGAVFASVKDWSLLLMLKPGSYERKLTTAEITNPIIKSLMIEAIMHYLDTPSISIEFINTSAIFFPFDYHISIGDLDQKRFTVIKTIRDTIIERNPKIPYSL
ncbi:hypothetical protein ACH0B6_14065 [Solibacillus silvestris]